MSSVADNILIKKVSPAEIDQLTSFSRKVFMEAFLPLNNAADIEAYSAVAFTRENLLTQLHNPSSEFYFAFIGAELAGYLKLNFHHAQSEFRDPAEMEVERIYVDAGFQNKRVGQQLLDFAINLGQNRALRSIWLGVWEHNQRAISFYQRNGFEQFGSHDFMLGNDRQVDLLLKRPL